MNLLFKCYDKKDNKIKDVTMLDFSQWWLGTGNGDGERNSFRNEGSDRHVLMPHIGKKDIDGIDICGGHVVEDTVTGNIYMVEMRDFAWVLVNHDKVVFVRNDLKLRVVGCIYEPAIVTIQRFMNQRINDFQNGDVQSDVLKSPHINYRKLKGLRSHDMWGNVTEITEVEDDVIHINTYRKHSHPSSTHRMIWRDDYYPEPTVMGGFDRFVTELKICGFSIDKLILDGYFNDGEERRHE